MFVSLYYARFLISLSPFPVVFVEAALKIEKTSRRTCVGS